MKSTDGTTKNYALCPLPTDHACAEVRLRDASRVVNPPSSPVCRIERRGNTVAYKTLRKWIAASETKHLLRGEHETFITVLQAMYWCLLREVNL